MPVLNEYKYQQKIGGDLNKYLENLKFGARDNGRTPFQWDNSPNAGFTSGEPWLKVNPNYNQINAKAQESDPNSTLNYFRKVVALRKSNPVLTYGKYKLLDKDNPNVYAYTRIWQGQKMLVLLNFTANNASTNLGIDVSKAKVLLSNYQGFTLGKSLDLKPYQAVVLRLN
jgi:oligo-1,6-glucosidase